MNDSTSNDLSVEQYKQLLQTFSTTVSGVIGPAYYRAVVKMLSESLGLDYVFIGEYVNDFTAITTRAGYGHGAFLESITYDLEGTPCDIVMGQGLCVYSSGVQQAFPTDKYLEIIGVESYMGATLYDSDDRGMGIINVLHSEPIKNKSVISACFDIIAGRTAAEMERMKKETQLQNALILAENANQAKSEFLSSMSHELRTPLNAILGFAQLLKVNEKDPLSASQLSYLENIEEGGEHLLGLVNSILDLIHIKEGQIDLDVESFNPIDLVEEAIGDLAPIAAKKNITIKNTMQLETVAPVKSDKGRFKQILLNILMNAIQYNKDQGSVDIYSELVDGKFQRIYVKDTGVGIPEDQRQRLFDSFRHFEYKSKVSKTGLGISLAVSQLLLQSLAGHIDYESELDEGTTFWIDLPLETNQEVVIWDRQVQLDVEALDQDHQKILSMINKAWRRDLAEGDMDHIFAELLSFSKYHFIREEKVMEICDYKGLEEFRQIHGYYIDQFNEMTLAWQGKRNDENLMQLRAYLREWWLTHIQKIDDEVASCARGKDQEIRQKLLSIS